jgi:hypothetical protein
MRRRSLVAAAATIAAVAAGGGAATARSDVSFTIGDTGAECLISSTSLSCQTATSALTLSAVLTPDGKVAKCSQPQGASPGCILWPGVVFPRGFVDELEPQVGGLACVPVGHELFAGKPSAAVCTDVVTGKGFRISTGKIALVSTILPGPHPPCTRAALTTALKRAYRKRSLAPSYLAKGWQCAGNFARGDLIAVHGRTADDVTVVFRQTERAWKLVGRATVCYSGRVPARIWKFSCAVN